jgi:hypothetical protein
MIKGLTAASGHQALDLSQPYVGIKGFRLNPIIARHKRK